MNFTLVDWLILFFVPLIAWVIGMKNRSVGSWRGYFLAQRTLPTTSVAATYFGANLTFTAIFLVLSEESYRRGAWVFSVPVCWIFGTVLFYFLYKKIKPFLDKGKTLHQAIGEAFNSKLLQKIASIWTILAFVGTVGLEFYGGIKLLQWLEIPLLNSLSLALVFAFIVASFTALGGFRSVAYADLFLDAVTILGVAIITYFLFATFQVHTIFSAATPETLQKLADVETSIRPITDIKENLAFAFGMFFIFVPFQICTLDSWQRMASWNKGKESKKANDRKKTGESLLGVLVLPSVFLAIIYCTPILLGMTLLNNGVHIPSNSHPLKEFLISVNIPPILIGIVVSGFIAAVFSTADELLNCSSLSLLFDTFQIPRDDQNRTQHNERRLVFAGQVYTGLFAFAAALIAVATIWNEKRISEWAIVVFSTQVVFTIPLLFALFMPNVASRSRRAAIYSMILSFVTALVCIGAAWSLNSKELSDGAPIVAFFVAGLVFGISKLVTPAKEI